MKLNLKYSKGKELEERDGVQLGKGGLSGAGANPDAGEREIIREPTEAMGECALARALAVLFPCLLRPLATPSGSPGMGALFRGSGPLVPSPTSQLARPCDTLMKAPRAPFFPTGQPPEEAPGQGVLHVHTVGGAGGKEVGNDLVPSPCSNKKSGTGGQGPTPMFD